MENVDDADAGFTDIEDYDETITNGVLGPPRTPALVSAPASRALSRQGSANQNRQPLSRKPTPIVTKLPDYGASRLPPSGQASGHTGTTQATFVPPIPSLTDVTGHLQTMSTTELQRLLILDYKKLIETLSQAIDDPNQDRVILNYTRKVLADRISEIEAAIAWRSLFESTSSGALGSEAKVDAGSLSLPIRLPTINHLAPVTSPTPRPSTTSPAQQCVRLDAGSLLGSYMRPPPSTTSRTPSPERVYPHLPIEDGKVLSPRQPASATDRAKWILSLESSWLASGKGGTTSSTDAEPSDRESDEYDTAKTRITKAPKHSPLTGLSSLDSIQDANVTMRSPRKRRGINGPHLSSRSLSSSKANSHKEPTTINVSIVPPADTTTSSNHLVPLVPMDTQHHLFNHSDSGLNTPVQIEEEQSTSVYKDEITDKLKNVFGLETFRTNQARAVDATMAGHDVFVLMPTGGKSLCYQLPAVCTTGKTKGVTIVISPLKSLMADQLCQLRDKGIDIIMLNSDLSSRAAREARARLAAGKIKPSLVYVTPERLEAYQGQDQDTRQILNGLVQQGELARFVIDEAHCISTWGRDFRIAYSALASCARAIPIFQLWC
ncbi:hypothetical protein B0J17DRAFT_427748 [Rhizoctonia solani]|nr:hypothetical protein B0J17DRAFT_427748 [Rhizoctonia solani]